MKTLPRAVAASGQAHQSVPLESKGYTDYLVCAGRGIGASSLPEEVLDVARLCVLDWFAVAIAGASEPLVGKLLAEAHEQGGNPLCTVIGNVERTSPAWAALINGSAADALDYSDINRAMRGHSTPAVIAAALATAEAREVSGLEFLAGVVAGIEVECRVGLLVDLPYLRQGYHPTGTIAHFGAAAAVAHLLRLSDEGWAHALGIAATQAAGLVASAGTMCKPFHSGKAAMNGLLAANLASRGFVGRPDALEAPQGFLATHASGVHSQALDEARDRFLILDTIFKHHAACMLAHSSIENMLAFRREHRIAPDGIKRIEVRVPASSLSVCHIEEPATGLEAKFSLRTACAMALLGDDTADTAAYATERVTRPELRRLAARIQVKEHDIEYGASLAVAELADGRRLEVAHNAYHPLRDSARQRERVRRKFHSLLEPILGAHKTAELQHALLQLDRCSSVRTLMNAAVRPAA